MPSIDGQINSIKVKNEDVSKLNITRIPKQYELSKITLIFRERNKRNISLVIFILLIWTCLLNLFMYQEWKILDEYLTEEKQQLPPKKLIEIYNTSVSITFDKLSRFSDFIKKHRNYFGMNDLLFNKTVNESTIWRNIKTLLKIEPSKISSINSTQAEHHQKSNNLENRHVIDIYFDPARIQAIKKYFSQLRIITDKSIKNTTLLEKNQSKSEINHLMTSSVIPKIIKPLITITQNSQKLNQNEKAVSNITENRSFMNDTKTFYIKTDSNNKTMIHVRRIFGNLTSKTDYENEYFQSIRENNVNLWKYFSTSSNKINVENLRNNFNILPYVMESGNAKVYFNKQTKHSIDGKYLQYNNLINGAQFEEYSNLYKITLVTQTTLNRLYSFVNTASNWNGPISVAIFLNGPIEYFLLRAYLSYLKRCHRKKFEQSRFSVSTASVNPIPKLTLIQSTLFDQIDCAASEIPIRNIINKNVEESNKWLQSHWYPQNMMRNQAKQNSFTPYHLVLDIDIIPCFGMSESLNKFLMSSSKIYKNGLVIPTYEVSTKVEFPKNKAELVALTRKRTAQPFHKEIFVENQNATNFPKWEKIHDSFEDVHIVHTVTPFQMYYEPFFVEYFTSPYYDEIFTGYGFTRSSHAYEMNAKTGHFQVLSPVFTVQLGLQQMKQWSAERQQQNDHNRQLFEKFVKNINNQRHSFVNNTKKLLFDKKISTIVIQTF